MINILAINSSITGADSVSRPLVQTVLGHFSQAAEVQIVSRDVGAHPLPYLTAETLAGVRGEPRTPAELEARALSDQLIAELRAADVVVIGAPMYNLSVPSTLKTWFDFIIRARETFTYADGAVKGLLTGKRVIVVSSRGGRYAEGPAQGHDFQEPYIRQILGFIGMTDVQIIRAEGVALGGTARADAIAAAREAIAALEPGDLAAAA